MHFGSFLKNHNGSHFGWDLILPYPVHFNRAYICVDCKHKIHLFLLLMQPKGEVYYKVFSVNFCATKFTRKIIGDLVWWDEHTHTDTHWTRQSLAFVSCQHWQLCRGEQAGCGSWLTSIFNAAFKQLTGVFLLLMTGSKALFLLFCLLFHTDAGFTNTAIIFSVKLLIFAISKVTLEQSGKSIIWD